MSKILKYHVVEHKTQGIPRIDLKQAKYVYQDNPTALVVDFEEPFCLLKGGGRWFESNVRLSRCSRWHIVWNKIVTMINKDNK